MAKSRDLFDDTTMSFGEHLEVLRVHVARALLGVVLAIIASLFFGDRIFDHPSKQLSLNAGLWEWNLMCLRKVSGNT